MTTTWKSDTCNCIIEFADNLKIIKIINECKNHTHSIGINFIGCESQLHNRTINSSVVLSDPKNPTKLEIDSLRIAKSINFKI